MAQDILYYPTIEFANADWLKAALMVWDHVYRIVPASYRPEDSGAIREAVYADRVRNVVLEEDDIRRTGDEFLSFCSDLPFLPAGMEGDRIHRDKVDERLYPTLDGVAADLEREGWLTLTPGVARGYMFFLSRHVAERRSLVRGTDDRDAWTIDPFFAANANFSEYVYDRDAEELYCSLFVRDLIPANIAGTRMKDVLRFVEKRGDERRHFREEIEALSSSLANCESESHAMEVMHDHVVRFSRAKEDFVRSSGLVPTGFGLAAFVVGIPMALSVLSLFIGGNDPFNVYTVGSSLALGAIAAYADAQRVTRADKALASTSYLVDVDRELAQNGRVPAFHRIFEEFVND